MRKMRDLQVLGGRLFVERQSKASLSHGVQAFARSIDTIRCSQPTGRVDLIRKVPTGNYPQRARLLTPLLRPIHVEIDRQFVINA